MCHSAKKVEVGSALGAMTSEQWISCLSSKSQLEAISVWDSNGFNDEVQKKTFLC